MYRTPTPRLAVLAACAAAGVAGAACGSDTETVKVGGRPADSVVAAPPATAAAPATLSDGTMLATLDSAYSRILEEDRAAFVKVSDPNLRMAITQSISLGGIGRATMRSTAQILQIAPGTPDVNLVADHAQALKTIESKPAGTEFDRTYAKRMQETRTTLIARIDEALAYSRPPLVRRALVDARAKLEADRTRVQQAAT